MLRIALPKGRLYSRCIDLFRMSGLDLSVKSREFVATNEEAGIQAIIVKNQDLPRYVYHGAASMGICGTDIIDEYSYDFFTLLSLPFGTAKLCVAVPKETYPLDYRISGLKIATKYVSITQQYFYAMGIMPRIVPLNGSIEIAPSLDLAHCIVDIVETGSTLKANNLVIQDEIKTTEVQLVANRAHYKFHFQTIDDLVAPIAKVL